jgi:hypothetical protein
VMLVCPLHFRQVKRRNRLNEGWLNEGRLYCGCFELDKCFVRLAHVDVAVQPHQLVLSSALDNYYGHIAELVSRLLLTMFFWFCAPAG